MTSLKFQLFIRLYLDEDVQRGVAAALRGRGFDAISAHEVGRWGLSDAEQLACAAADQRALFTFDAADFLRLHRRWIESGRPHGGISVSAQGIFSIRRGGATVPALGDHGGLAPTPDY